MRLRLAVLLAFPVFIFLWIWLAATAECGPGASCIASARVEDRQYAVSIGRAMQITDADLMPYAIATRRSGGPQTVDEQTYRLGELDPTKVLVMKLVPGQVDDAGSLGSYLILFGESFDGVLLCPYQPTGGPMRPSECP